MTLAEVQGTTALVVFLTLTWACLIIATALLFPKQTGQAESALGESPLRSLLIGLAMLIPTAIGIGIIQVPSPVVKLVGFLMVVAISAALAVGASGIAKLMGRRISDMSSERSGFSELARGAAIYSLSLGFPFIGWFLFVPVSLIVALGAGTRALWRSSQSIHPPVSPGPPQYDVLERRGAV